MVDNEEIFLKHFSKIKAILDVEPDLEIFDKDSLELSVNNGEYHWMNNQNLIKIKRLLKVRTLAHECRHAWQFKNRVKQRFDFIDYTSETTLILRFSIAVANFFTYFYGRKEKDANNFALTYCEMTGLTEEVKELRKSLLFNKVLIVLLFPLAFAALVTMAFYLGIIWLR